MTRVDCDLLLRGAGQLVTCVPRAGREPLGTIDDGALAACAGRVVWVGRTADAETACVPLPGATLIDATGHLVTPGLIDAHTHPIFAGERGREFALRAAGASYLEIAAAGGGILSTVRATRAASDQQLLALCRQRLRRMLAAGTTFAEAKSGYDLSIEGELRLLRLLHQLGEQGPLQLSPTLLAHVVPDEARGSEAQRANYVRQVCEVLIPRVAREGLAEACDVYCDAGAFRLDEARRILLAARQAGLGLRIHAEQFHPSGAAALAAELGALSADHLERVAEGGVTALAASQVTAVLLPAAGLTVHAPAAPARQLLDAGVAVALATDLNPGTSLTESLPLVMSLACTQLGMTVEEAWLGCTQQAARAVARPDRGQLGPGAVADLVVWSCTDYCHVPYHLGSNHVATVVVGGRVAFQTMTPGG